MATSTTSRSSMRIRRMSFKDSSYSTGLLLLPLSLLLLLLSSLDAFLLQTPPRPRATPRRSQPLSMSSSSTTTASDSSITQQIVTLSTGLTMEVLTAKPSSPSSSFPPAFPSPFSALFQPKKAKATTNPPLVFLHGSFHSAWCWSEHFLPFFASKGYDCYALSFRGTSRSPSPSQESSITINTHAADLRAFLQTTFPPSSSSPSPIVIGHSFGGAILMKLLEQQQPQPSYPPPPLFGAVFLCSVPPSGNGPMTARFLKRDLILALKIVLGFVAKKAAQWDWLCRELFFTPALPPTLLREYKERLALDSVVAIDVKDFLNELPSLRADEQTGRGRWVGQVPHRLVIGAVFDKLVDKEGVDEMAAFADAGAPVFLPLAHDVMLGPDWPIAAEALLEWVEGFGSSKEVSRR